MRSVGHGIQRQHINEGGSQANWTDPTETHKRCKQFFLSQLKAWDEINVQLGTENGNAIVIENDTVFGIHEVGQYQIIQLPVLFPIRAKIYFHNFPLSRDRQSEKELHPHHLV